MGCGFENCKDSRVEIETASFNLNELLSRDGKYVARG